MVNAIENSSTIKLSGVHLSLMSAGAQREDKCLSPTTKLKGAMCRKAADKLIESGLARELRSKPGMPVWRRDEETGIEYSLKLTAAGTRALTVQRCNETPQQEGSSNELEGVNEITNVGATTASLPSEPVTASSGAPRPGSKIAAVLELLARVEGASLKELIGATGWLPHTTRAALTGLRQRGYLIDRNQENAVTRYRVLNTSTLGAIVGPQKRQTPKAGDDEQRPGVGKSRRTKGNAERSGAETISPSAS